MERILVVDDNRQNCELLKDILITWGYRPDLAYQGLEAIEMAGKDPPDLILLDVMLPGLNGFETCRELKAHLSTKDIPIIMQTVLDETDDRIRGYKVGASLFLTKPVNYSELKNHIQRLIQIKNDLENREEREAVVQTLVRIMSALRPDLYSHSAQVKTYCEKTAGLLAMDAHSKERLKIAAWLHDLGMLEAEQDHAVKGLELLRGLKMYDWLGDFLIFHHERADGSGPLGKKEEDLPEEVWLLNAVNTFVRFLNKHGDQEAAFIEFQRQCPVECFPSRVIGALHQVVLDELFLMKAFPGGSGMRGKQGNANLI